MASAHGAGLMVVPTLVPLCLSGSGTDGTIVTGPAIYSLAAVCVHTAAMVAVSGLIAIAVYEWIGVGFLRRGWLNLDWLWTGALGVTGKIVIALSSA